MRQPRTQECSCSTQIKDTQHNNAFNDKTIISNDKNKKYKIFKEDITTVWAASHTHIYTYTYMYINTPYKYKNTLDKGTQNQTLADVKFYLVWKIYPIIINTTIK